MTSMFQNYGVINDTWDVGAIEALADKLAGRVLSVGDKDFSVPKKLTLEGVTDEH